MFFRRKKEKDVKDVKDIEEIKEAISSETLPPIPTSPVAPTLPAAPTLPTYQKDIIQREIPTERKEFAPLFIKLEKYKEILSSIQEIKVFISGIKQLFTVLSDLESLRGDAIKIMRATVQRLEKSLIEIDTELLKPRGIDIEFPHGEVEMKLIEDSLTELQKQISSLRNELGSLK